LWYSRSEKCSLRSYSIANGYNRNIYVDVKEEEVEEKKKKRLLVISIEDARSVSLYPYNQSQVLQNVRYT